MRSLQLADRLSNAVVLKNLIDSRNTINRTRWQIIFLIQIGNIHSADLLSRLMDLSVHSIYEIVERYNHSGIEALSCEPKCGRKRSLLSLHEEAFLLVSLEALASKGLIKAANDIRKVAEQKTGKPVSDGYLWDLLHGNGWKKKMPGPHHPKRSAAQQAEFKKNSPKSWSPLQ